MLKLTNDVLEVVLPEGKTQEELVKLLSDELTSMESQFYGKSIKINGRITTAMALHLGHKLAHICKDVSIFDPKTASFVKAVWH